jgi:lipoprotein-releasing system permease protein
MALPYEFHLAGRNLSRHPVHTGAMAGGLAMAVLVMVYIPSTMASFYDDIKDRAIEQNSAHVTVWPREKPHGQMDRALRGELGPEAVVALADRTFPRHRDLNGYHAAMRRVEDVEGVVAVAAFVRGNATVRYGRVDIGVTLEGIDPIRYSRVVNIARHFGPDGAPDLGPSEIAIGFRMADKLGVHAGEHVRVATAGPEGGAAIRPMKVAAIFHSGYYDKDLHHAYVSLKTAQRMLGMGNEVSALAARCEELGDAPAVSGRIGEVVRCKVRNWRDDNASLLQEMATIQLVTMIINVLVAATAAVGIANVFSMFVYNRRKELAILRAMGAAKMSLRWVLLLEAMFIWVMGASLGTSAAVGVMAYEQAYPLYQMSAETYGIDSYATQPKALAFAAAWVLSLATIVFSAVRSGQSAANLSPVRVIFGR